MRTSYIKNSDSWKKINQLYIKDQSIWTDVKEAYVKKDDQWRLWYVKSVPSMETLSLDLNQSGSLNVSVSGGSYYVTQPTEYRALVDGVYQVSSATTTISNIPITSGANRVLSIQVWRGDFLLYTLTKNFRLFDYTGSSQSWVVPSGVSTLMSDVQGAKGGDNAQPGGLGGRLKGLITVTSGETLYLYVGGQGQNRNQFNCVGSAPAVLAGGFNGGGSGGRTSDSYLCPSGTATYRLGASGGGATDIRRGGTALGNRVIIAGGGGGGVGGTNSGPGGDGNGSGNGANGFSSGQPFWPDNTKGFGGTTTAGGAAGGGVASGTAGSLGQGGNGALISVFGDNPGEAGGGGGGYYGGGGGGSNTNYGSGGSGGGGSGFITGGIFEASSLGYRSGNGVALVSW